MEGIEAFRIEMRAGFDRIEAKLEDLRSEFGGLRSEIKAGDEETRNQLRSEIKAGDEETRSLMRVLHEDVLDRISRLAKS